LLYIDSIVGWDQSLRRWPAGIAVVALLAAVMLLSGCGGSGDQTTGGGATTAAGADSTSPQTAVAGTTGDAAGQKKIPAGGDGQNSGRNGRRPRGDDAGNRAGSHHGADDSSPGSKHSTGTSPAEDQKSQKSQAKDRPAHRSQQGAASTGIEGASPVVVKKLRKRCPKGMEAAACDDLVKAYVAAQNPNSQPSAPQPESGRCPESLSQAECEAALAELAAAEKGGSVNVDDCLADMTPQCEEALRSSFEAQHQAREEAGE
jgi:hypothetical protein